MAQIEDPRPCRLNPPLDFWWPVWALYGLLIRRPLRRMWEFYTYYGPTDDRTDGAWRFALSKDVYNWLHRGNSQWKWRLRMVLTDSYSCERCGDDDYGDSENEAYYDMVFCNSYSGYEGMVSEWGGWAICRRCGFVGWCSDST